MVKLKREVQPSQLPDSNRLLLLVLLALALFAKLLTCHHTPPVLDCANIDALDARCVVAELVNERP